MRKKIGILWVLLIAAFVFMSGGCGGGSSDFAGGSGTSDDPWQITTPVQLANVKKDLDAHFVLTGDIDLAAENWAPIGDFVPASDNPGDETPDMELAFTGVFDGGGRTISNVTIDNSAGAAIGLFGCVAGDGVVSNLTVKDADVKGGALVAAVVGYGAGKAVENVHLVGDNRIEGGGLTEGTARGMVGGIVGGGFCDIIDCSAEAEIILDVSSEGVVGVLAGGMEDSDIIGCSAKGTVTVTGNNNFGIGGLVGSAQESDTVQNCTSDVVMKITGNGNDLIGGLAGFAGKEGDSEYTLISECEAKASITMTGSDNKRIGGIVGGGFYVNMYSTYFPKPCAIQIKDCETSGSIAGGSYVGSIIGYAYNNSTVTNCTSTAMSGPSNQIGSSDPNDLSNF
ncbi:MAG: hypothetical protein LBS35_04715 [Synergistaceae bacterium]|nr:hypothetical protein [Synergistaceae bacterium]